MIQKFRFAWTPMAIQVVTILGAVACFCLTAVSQKPQLEISPGNAQLVDKEPFDRIYLDEFNNFSTLDIIPLEVIPTKPYPGRGELVFEKVDFDEFKLQVPWNRVIDYKTFDQLLLDESELLLEQKNFSRAFRNLLYVYDNGSNRSPELRKQLKRVLVRDGVENFNAGNHSLALSIFEDVYRASPKEVIDNVKAIDMIMKGYDLMIKERFGNGGYEGVREILSTVERNYGDDVEKLQKEWSARLEEKNREYFSKAEQAIQSGDSRAAHSAARKAIYAMPDDVASANLLNQVIEKYPLVYVGVSETAPNGGDPTRTDNWAARRIGRVTQRTIVEFDGLGDEGGTYRFLNGTLERVDEEGFKYEFRLSNSNEFGVPVVTAYQISQQLLERADPESPHYHEPWSKIVGPISITDGQTVLVELRIPFIRPEALLQVAYEGAGPDGLPVQNGPYIVTEQTDEFTQFSRNPNYDMLPTSQYPELVELKYENPSDAVDALLKGDIDVIDRVPHQDLRALSRNPFVRLSKYKVPTIAMLIPNNRNDFTKNLDFRSGLFRAINREAILTEGIAAGREISGCELLTGPFPIGTEDNDQIGYAYNPKIKQINYDIVLATVLVSVVKGQLEARAREERAKERIAENEGQEPSPDDKLNEEDVIRLEYPELVLAYPQGEISSLTCQSIKRMWGEIGVSVTLRELPAGQSAPEDEDFDFLYVEIAMSEPLTDVEILFGNDGLAKNLSAPVQQLVRKLSYSTSWAKAGRNLRQMHRQVLNNVSVIPLFQVQEFFAYRKNVKNLGRDVVNLYENIDGWEVVPLDQVDSSGK